MLTERLNELENSYDKIYAALRQKSKIDYSGTEGKNVKLENKYKILNERLKSMSGDLGKDGSDYSDILKRISDIELSLESIELKRDMEEQRKTIFGPGCPAMCKISNNSFLSKDPLFSG